MATEVERVKVAKSYKTPRETGLLVLAWVGFFVPLIWVASPAFWFAEYQLRASPLVAGVMCLVISLWLFYRSHADLGTNWSITLEVREGHRLITQGVYRGVRHPMVLGVAPLFPRPGPRYPELGGGSSKLGRVRGRLCASYRRGRENDVPAIWERIRRVHGNDEASYSARLVRRCWAGKSFHHGLLGGLCQFSQGKYGPRRVPGWRALSALQPS